MIKQSSVKEGNIIYITEKRKCTEGENTDSAGSLVPIMFVIGADLTDLIQVVFEIPRGVNLHRDTVKKNRREGSTANMWRTDKSLRQSNLDSPCSLFIK